MKGSVGTFGARAAFETALKLEVMGREKDLAQAEAACAVLEDEIEALAGPRRLGEEDAPRALIAEDDIANRRLLEVTLSRWGYQVVVAGTGPRRGRRSSATTPRSWRSWTG